MKWIPETKEFKEGERLVQLKLKNGFNEIIASTSGELLELRTYAIIYQETSKINSVNITLRIPGKKKNFSRKEIIKQIDEKYPQGIIGSSFKQNEVIISSKIDHYFQVSPISGKVVKFDRENCALHLERDKRIERIISFASGNILQVNQDQISLRTSGSRIMGIQGLGENVSGEFGEEIMPIFNNIDFQNFMMNDIKGALVFQLPYRDFVNFSEQLEKKYLQKSLIVLGGFGNYFQQNEFSELCQRLQECYVYLSSFTRIRAGVKRPFIYFEAERIRKF